MEFNSGFKGLKVFVWFSFFRGGGSYVLFLVDNTGDSFPLLGDVWQKFKQILYVLTSNLDSQWQVNLRSYKRYRPLRLAYSA